MALWQKINTRHNTSSMNIRKGDEIKFHLLFYYSDALYFPSSLSSSILK